MDDVVLRQVVTQDGVPISEENGPASNGAGGPIGEVISPQVPLPKVPGPGSDVPMDLPCGPVAAHTTVPGPAVSQGEILNCMEPLNFPYSSSKNGRKTIIQPYSAF